MPPRTERELSEPFSMRDLTLLEALIQMCSGEKEFKGNVRSGLLYPDS
jgi:hypothetical protein